MGRDKEKKDAKKEVAEKRIQKTVKEPKKLDKTKDFSADCTTHRKQ